MIFLKISGNTNFKMVGCLFITFFYSNIFHKNIIVDNTISLLENSNNIVENK